jgi:hypothetical protein
MSVQEAAPPSDRLEILLRTLRSERHFRRSLLVEVIDRLHRAGLPAAADAALDLLDTLDHNAPDFERRVAVLERLVVASRRGVAA